MPHSDAHDERPALGDMFTTDDIRPFLDLLTRSVLAGMSERHPEELTLMPRSEALCAVRRYLSTKPTGWQFRVRDLYDDICATTSRTPQWVRSEVAGTLTAEGLVQRGPLDGIYITTARVGQVTDHGDLPDQQ